jgi:GT2 family glycosyltransferase
MLQRGDQLAPHALRRCGEALALHPGALVLYADEDRLTPSGRRHSPQFKPAWNPELLYADPHYSHCWLIRSDLAQRVARELEAAGESLSLYGLVLEATAACRAEQIVHLPEMLYHRADRPGERRGDPESAATVERFLARRGQRVPVTVRAGGGHRLHWPLPAPLPLVSVIIPTRDRGEMLRRCIDSLQDQAEGSPPTELLVIDNGSRDPATLSYLAELAERPGVRMLRRPGPFNFAAFNNEAAQLARGEVLAFLNNDVEALRPGWLRAMVAEAVRPGIGAVGARLLFDDGTVQHAGVLLGIGGIAGHAHKYAEADAAGYQLRLRLTHAVSAVTAATLVIRRSLFLEVGGFDAERFAVNYNDVDLCLRLGARGLRTIFCADAELIHHESRSRGAPSSPEALSQWQREREAMEQRWGLLLQADPHYSPHLSLLEENFSLALRREPVRARAGGAPQGWAV